jgi:hypothetical protein
MYGRFQNPKIPVGKVGNNLYGDEFRQRVCATTSTVLDVPGHSVGSSTGVANATKMGM